MIRSVILVGIGGGVGSILRYLVSVGISKYYPTVFPWPTFAVNIFGCLIIGLLLGYLEKHQLPAPELRYLFVTGFCGGFTTFSTFSFENISLIQEGNTSLALVYMGASIVVCLAAVWLGLALTK